MHVKALKCVDCDEEYSPDKIKYRCESCGSSLDVVYDYDEIKNKISWDKIRERTPSHLRYREFLPLLDPKFVMEMGEGGTPLMESAFFSEKLNIDLHFKMESLNPTGSFKDRGTSVELGKALEHGAGEVVVASTGNMGSSIAAYCARAGVNAKIYVPEDVGGPKLRQMKEHGAEIFEVEGDYSLAAERAWNEWEENRTYLMGDYPYRGEGEKTVGHEIGDQIDADKVVLPVGNGTLIHGTWKGLKELKKVDLKQQTPQMVGVQAEGCNTVVKALKKGYENVRPVEETDTVAGAIACADPLDGDQALNSIKQSNGFGTAVTDDEIIKAKRLLAEKEGIYAEEAGAAPLAGILKNRKKFEERETVVCVITGHGLKT
ncbi:MAG: threonine synthase [Candidatus Aenigmatarchaeota archaeon]